MKKIIFTLVAILFSTLAFSHGPTPQKVQESVTIAASPEKTWEALKNYSAFEKIMKVRSFKDKLMKAKYELIKTDVPFSDYNAQIRVKKGENIFRIEFICPEMSLRQYSKNYKDFVSSLKFK